MKKTTLHAIASIFILLVTFPMISPSFAASSINVVGTLQKVSEDDYLDMVFTAQNALGEPIEAIEVNVGAEETGMPLFNGKTDSSGTLIFWDVPPLNYIWTASTGDSGSFVNEVPVHEFDLPDKAAVLSWILWMKWCEDSTEKGQSLLKGIADLMRYAQPLPTPDPVDDMKRIAQYNEWIQGFRSYLEINKNTYHPDVYETTTTITDALTDVITIYGAKSLELGLPLEQAKSILDATEGYKYKYFMTHAPEKGAFNIFSFRNGMQAGALAIIAGIDLFMVTEGHPEHTFELLFSDDFAVSSKLEIYGDFATLATSFVMLTTQVFTQANLVGAGAINLAINTLKALGMVSSAISCMVIAWNLAEKYGTWQHFVEHLNSPDVIYNLALFCTSAATFIVWTLLALKVITLTTAVSWIPIIGAVAIIATILYLAWNWITEYWAYVDRIREQISATMDQVIPIMQTLRSYDTAKLQREGDYYGNLADAALTFSDEAAGELKEDLKWASDYFSGLEEAQDDFMVALTESSACVDDFVKMHLNYNSVDGTKHIRAHLEGINSTSAKCFSTGDPDFFTFVASVYHPSDESSSVYKFDKHTVTYGNLDGDYSEVDYPKISSYDPLDVLHPQNGWAWAPPVEHDAHDRTFAATYATDQFTTGSNFYFDPAGQWYASPLNLWRFDPDENYRSNSMRTDDSFSYHYKFFFDSGTTGEYWGLGRPDSLDEWMTAIKASLPNLETKFGAFSSAQDNLIAAFSRKQVPVSDAIGKGLAWLRTSQSSDGSWQDKVGITALCVLGFLNAGYDESDSTVQKAIAYLLSRNHDGAIYTNEWGLTRATYETSLALLPLVATYNSDYDSLINSSKNWLISSQWDENCLWGSISKDNWYYGGFGYGSGSRPDLSNTQFALLALDAAGLPKDDPTWVKAQVFLHRCQKVNFPIALNIESTPYTVQPWNYAGTAGGYDGGFLYTPGSNPYVGGAPSMESMTGAGIWGLLLSGVPKSDQRVTEAINWVANHYTWDTNPNCAENRRYYYYLSMAKALTMYGEKIIGGHDWYQELYSKITSPTEMIAVGADKAKWVPVTYEDYVPDLPTAYAILSLQTRTGAQPVRRLSYITFILRSNCFLRVLDSDGNLVGYNYLTDLGENNIPSAIYSGPFSETQYIVIVNPKFDTYKLGLVGNSEGPYELTIQGNYGEEITDNFEFPGEIKPEEVHGTDITVTSVVGPLDIYVNPPKPIDTIPPNTTLILSGPNMEKDNITYITRDTIFTLNATDNVPSGITTAFMIFNDLGYTTGWIRYNGSANLPPLVDGSYTFAYRSIDESGNVEQAKEVRIRLFSWNFIFVDTLGRGTSLKVNIEHGLFQFVAPGADYGLRNATHMFTHGNVIRINHDDGQLCIIAVAVGGKLDVCIASAYDRRTDNRYLLVDKAGVEVPRRHGTAILI